MRFREGPTEKVTCESTLERWREGRKLVRTHLNENPEEEALLLWFRSSLWSRVGIEQETDCPNMWGTGRKRGGTSGRNKHRSCWSHSFPFRGLL